MKRPLLAPLALATILLSAARILLPQSEVQTISGPVIRADTRTPLPRVQLELVLENDARLPTGHEKPCRPESSNAVSDRRRRVSTDENGRFQFENVNPGRYHLFAEREGFLKAAYGQRGRFPIPEVLEVGTASGRTFSVSDTELPEELPRADSPLTPRSLIPTATRGGLGRDQQGLTAGATSPIRDGNPTGLRGGLGRDLQGIPNGAGAPSAIVDGDRNVLQNIAFALSPAPAIAGVVLDDTGAPVTAASVEAYQYRFTPLNGRVLRPMRNTLTDDRGAYRLFWLDTGRYIVAAGNNNRLLEPWLSLMRLTPNLPDPHSGNPTLFFPSATTVAEASTVNVDPGTGPFADFRLRDRPRFNVQVRLVANSPGPDAALVFVPAGGDFCVGLDYAVASRDGSFVVRDVVEGLYVMVAVSGRDVISELATVTVDRNLSREIALPRTSPVEVRGTVYVEGPVAESDLSALRVNLTRAGQELSQIASAGVDPMTKRFSIPGMGPGAYYVTVDLPPGLFVKDVVPSRFDPAHPEDCAYVFGEAHANSYYLDAHGHLDPQKAIHIPSVIPNAATCVSILVSSGTALFGYTRDAGNHAVRGALVVGIPRSVWKKEEDRGLTPPDRYITAVSDNVGFFVLPAVPSTEYRLYAFESLDPNDIFDPAFAERFQNREIFIYRRWEYELGKWVVKKVFSSAIASEAAWCAGNTIAVRERCYLTVIPAEVVDRQ